MALAGCLAGWECWAAGSPGGFCKCCRKAMQFWWRGPEWGEKGWLSASVYVNTGHVFYLSVGLFMGRQRMCTVLHHQLTACARYCRILVRLCALHRQNIHENLQNIYYLNIWAGYSRKFVTNNLWPCSFYVLYTYFLLKIRFLSDSYCYISKFFVIKSPNV